MTTILSAQALSVARSGQQVLRDVSFDIEQGEVHALLGGNGAGKSTTLLTFLGFLSPASGSAQVQGREACDNIAAARQAIAYLPESASLYGHLNAYENLRYFLSLAKAEAHQPALDTALERVALQADAREMRMQTYSKGMRQKVAIALAILREAPILLLDEPTSGLDPAAIDEFNRLVRDLAENGRTILLVTHDVYGACHVADRIHLLHKGELVGTFDRPAGMNRIDTEAVHTAFATHSSA
ncbi:MAG: ABC transporter ATP-binding protein [Gammaproteobacteria bacterium]|nr:ABC transporter ATP-binding protein [Gammaproteobacteria bacterium]MCY4278912.1 ABC transporter ATP-binding protein [Gammaproteobacteria bacterium]MCY4322419.1 ABC transporter ATP-binding protein [Gammaproteobacteria bacterium]